MPVPTRTVRGLVPSPDGTPAAQVPVVVGEDFFSPAVSAQTRADVIFEFRAVAEAAPCDAAGRYRIDSLRPGDYYALAFPAARAARVAVRAGETTSLDLRIPR